MSASDSLFCFTSNKIDFHPCPNCRAPMLVRIKSAGPDLSLATFECFNCDNVVVIPGHRLSLRVGAGDARWAFRMFDIRLTSREEVPSWIDSATKNNSNGSSNSAADYRAQHLILRLR
jgi:hypothetical protein